MKKINFLIAIVFSMANFSYVLATCGGGPAPEEQVDNTKERKAITKESNISLPPLELIKNKDYKGDDIVFRVKKSKLWVKNKDSKLKTNGNEVEVTLMGELFAQPKIIRDVSRKYSNTSTPEGLASAYFSATKASNVDWITDNFLGSEEEKVRALFKNKKTLEASSSGANSMKSAFITGKAKYKKYVLLFIEQVYANGQKITEALACKKTKKGWRLTSSLNNDETFDVVFAALASGNVEQN